MDDIVKLMNDRLPIYHGILTEAIIQSVYGNLKIDRPELTIEQVRLALLGDKDENTVV